MAKADWTQYPPAPKVPNFWHGFGHTLMYASPGWAVYEGMFSRRTGAPEGEPLFRARKAADAKEWVENLAARQQPEPEKALCPLCGKNHKPGSAVARKHAEAAARDAEDAPAVRDLKEDTQPYFHAEGCPGGHTGDCPPAGEFTYVGPEDGEDAVADYEPTDAELAADDPWGEE